MKKIGLVGGISWTSTIDYYKYINEGINEKLGGLNFAEMLIYSLNFGDVQKLSWDNAFEILYKACENLKKSGAEAIALGANTAHLYADEIQEKIQLPIIHIATATASEIKKNGITKVGLLGTKFTMEMDFYRDKLKENGLEVIVPKSQETRDYLQHIIKEELGRGIINPASKEEFLKITKVLIEQGAQGIVLGCTEIPLLITQQDITVPVFDTTKIHSKAIVDFALSN
jgi:aspartate racemase